jgi:hypothetical protein
MATVNTSFNNSGTPTQTVVPSQTNGNTPTGPSTSDYGSSVASDAERIGREGYEMNKAIMESQTKWNALGAVVNMEGSTTNQNIKGAESTHQKIAESKRKGLEQAFSLS